MVEPVGCLGARAGQVIRFEIDMLLWILEMTQGHDQFLHSLSVHNTIPLIQEKTSYKGLHFLRSRNIQGSFSDEFFPFWSPHKDQKTHTLSDVSYNQQETPIHMLPAQRPQSLSTNAGP